VKFPRSTQRYVWTFEGWLYLAVIMDLFSRQIVGWAMDKRMKVQLAIDALAMAAPFRPRQPVCLSAIPAAVSTLPDGAEYESQRGLLGQCSYRKILWQPQIGAPGRFPIL